MLPHLDVAQNVALPLLLQGRAGGALPGTHADPRAHIQGQSRATYAQATHDRVQAMLNAVGLEGLGTRLPQQLSGGQLQRVSIARALVHRPALLLADEPTGNLDPATAARVMDALISQTRLHNASLVLVTHSEAAAARADRVLKLNFDGIHP